MAEKKVIGFKNAINKSINPLVCQLVLGVQLFCVKATTFDSHFILLFNPLVRLIEIAPFRIRSEFEQKKHSKRILAMKHRTTHRQSFAGSEMNEM